MDIIPVVFIIFVFIGVYAIAKVYREYNKVDYKEIEREQQYENTQEEIDEEEEDETHYYVAYRCENCSMLHAGMIPYGMTVKSWITENEPCCENCKVEIKDNFSIYTG